MNATLKMYGFAASADRSRIVGIINHREWLPLAGSRSISSEPSGDSWPNTARGGRDAEAWSLRMNIAANPRESVVRS